MLRTRLGDLPLAERPDAGDRAKQSRLAGAGGAGQQRWFARCKGQVLDSRQCAAVGKIDRQILDRDLV